MKPRVYLVVIAAAMLALSIIVLAQNLNLSTELLGAIGFLSGVAVLISVLVELFGNGKKRNGS